MKMVYVFDCSTGNKYYFETNKMAEYFIKIKQIKSYQSYNIKL